MTHKAEEGAIGRSSVEDGAGALLALYEARSAKEPKVGPKSTACATPVRYSKGAHTHTGGSGFL